MSDSVTLRASGMGDYLDCSRRAAARLFPDRLKAMGFNLGPGVKNISAMVGTAVHKGLEILLRAKRGQIEHKSMVQLASAAARLCLETDALGDSPIQYDKTTKSLDEAVVQVERMVPQLVALVASVGEPYLVEFEIRQPLGKHTLSGHPDLVDARADGYHLVDLKTGRRKNYMVQLGVYSLALKEIGVELAGCEIVYLPRVQVKYSQPSCSRPDVYDLHQCELLAMEALTRFSKDIERFLETGDEWSFQANPSSMLCSEKWCLAWGTNFCTLTGGDSGLYEEGAGVTASDTGEGPG